MIEFLLNVFRESREDVAIVWHDHSFTYQWLTDSVSAWMTKLDNESIQTGSVVILEADFSPNAVALFLALEKRSCILVPLTNSVISQKNEFAEISQGEIKILIDSDDLVIFEKMTQRADHALYATLRERGHPGLVLFSSGSTGKSKAALHDLTGILEKFKVRRKKQRVITFLLYDHIGGINTMFYSLSNGGCIITLQDRTPQSVLDAVQKYQVNLLPTSPTFINMILLSEAYRQYDLSSLKTVTYGTETMPESTLKRFHQLFPAIELQQTYGLSEVGILRSKSKSSDSLWVRIGGEGFKTRIVDGILHIKAESAMLGYLNAPSPFGEDGWFITGDEVLEDGEYYQILGRRSELINVGGEKVYPAEVESVLLLMHGVDDVVVGREANPISGQIVVAKVNLSTGETLSQFRKRMREFCKEKLSAYKIPQKIVLMDAPVYSPRFKKMRL